LSTLTTVNRTGTPIARRTSAREDLENALRIIDAYADDRVAAA
jgi:hypothetical protein